VPPGFAFAWSSFRANLWAFVQHHAADQLHVRSGAMPAPACGFAPHHRKGFLAATHQAAGAAGRGFRLSPSISSLKLAVLPRSWSSLYGRSPPSSRLMSHHVKALQLAGHWDQPQQEFEHCKAGHLIGFRLIHRSELETFARSKAGQGGLASPASANDGSRQAVCGRLERAGR